MFPMGSMQMVACVRPCMVLDGSGLLCTSQYVPKGILQCTLALYLCLCTSSLGLNLVEMPDLTGKALSHRMIKCINLMVISLGMPSANGKVL